VPSVPGAIARPARRLPHAPYPGIYAFNDKHHLSGMPTVCERRGSLTLTDARFANRQAGEAISAWTV